MAVAGFKTLHLLIPYIMDNKNFEDNLFFYWTKNLVGTNSRFILNLAIAILFGTLYSFKIAQTNVILLIFGVVSPVIFTLCLYNLILLVSGDKQEVLNFPSVFLVKKSNRLLSIFDSSLVVLLGWLIYRGTLNYFFFRFLLTFFIPVLLIIFLRGLYFFITG
ncbi:MAG TPA: hypothetical protein PLA42_06370 [Tenuifilaceae bacterium]|nr:hypothetical protein [Bacteroidales bacterium]HOA09576.1 hypothetical protein [Tenuifilaceae bacterium]NLI87303.1 hypothetical protein [Bacteroidales bacterium]HOG72134.1 hypothetical protein [Tenuifilaceae bacterium]HOW21910.1 hypothetical protein [Tenuifilaceae bacterium]